MNFPNIKNQALAQCKSWAAERQNSIRKKEAQLQEALTGATKSSAGDKHNTERAMLQLEREQLGNQLAGITNDLNTLQRIDPHAKGDLVHLGSLVYTSQATYFISVSAGILTIDSQKVVALSSSSPIGKLLLGKTKGDSISWNNQQFLIEKIY